MYDIIQVTLCGVLPTSTIYLNIKTEIMTTYMFKLKAFYVNGGYFHNMYSE